MLTFYSPRPFAHPVLRVLLFCLLALLPMHLCAATFLVTDLNDYDSSNYNNIDAGSLRYAISQAYAAAYASNSPSIVVFQSGLTGTIHLVGTLNLPAGVNVEGPGGGQIKIDGGASSGNTFPDIEVTLGAQGSVAAISGLTIQNGNNNGTSALITGATNLGNGGGILVDNNAALSVTDCTFTDNMASGLHADGGALSGSTGSTVTASNCIFTDNQAGVGGAVSCGVDSNSSNPTTLTLTGCTFTGNMSSAGGAVDVAGGTATLTSCSITGNTASATDGGYGIGGGVYTEFGTAVLNGCTLAYNNGVAGGAVGGAGTMNLTNCLLVGNSAQEGGGLFNQDSSLTVTACTLTDNLATQSSGYTGGAIADDATLTNDILYNNKDGSGAISEIASDYPNGSATNCDIDETLGSGTDNFADDGGNINKDPMFIRAPGTNGASDTGDLHLQPSSRCLGTGATQAQAPSGVTIPTVDFTGATRPSPPSIGAYDAVSDTGEATTITVTSTPNPNASGQSVTFTATVAPTTGTGTPTGPVTFTIDGTAENPVALTNGSATFTTASLAVGPHAITASYSGDSDFTASSTDGTLAQVVGGQALADSTTTLTSSVNPSASGQSVTFTASVAPTSGTGTPTGTVTFTVDGTAGSPVTVANGQATFTTSSLSSGTHTVGVAYSGDSAFSASASSALTQTVQAVLLGTTTNLVSSANPSTVAQSVTFTATVAPTSGTGTPTGTVTFSVNNAAQTPVTLTNGQATFSTSSLTAGSQFITAAYSGDGTFAASVSATLTQTVNAATTGPTVLHTFTPGLQMISVTENYGLVPLATASNLPTGQTFFTWAGGPDYLTGTSLPAPGQGAWAYLTQNAAIYDAGTALSTSSPASISLTTGWNMIGDPFNAPEAISSLLVSQGGANYTLAQGNLHALVYTTLYTYPAEPVGSDAPYETKSLPDSLEPFAGYWIYAFQPCTLVIPAP